MATDRAAEIEMIQAEMQEILMSRECTFDEARDILDSLSRELHQEKLRILNGVSIRKIRKFSREISGEDVEERDVSASGKVRGIAVSLDSHAD